jgi:hypothetical protein
MAPLRLGALSGAIAGLVIAAALFVDYGPGTSLSQVARWFWLDAAGVVSGALLLVALGSLFGLLFARGLALPGRALVGREIAIERALIVGLVTGALWWLVVPLLYAGLIRQMPLSPYSTMLFLAIGLLYGAITANVYVALASRVRQA